MTALAAVESGTAVKVCTLSNQAVTEQCGALADTVIRVYDPRVAATTESYRCRAHRDARRIGIEVTAQLASFPGSWVQVQRLP